MAVTAPAEAATPPCTLPPGTTVTTATWTLRCVPGTPLGIWGAGEKKTKTRASWGSRSSKNKESGWT